MSIAIPRPMRDRARHVPVVRRSPKVLAAILIVVVSSFAISGCRMDDQMALMLDNPEQRHAITFDRSAKTLVIEAPERGMGLSKDQLAGLHSFMRHYKREASGHLVVSSPRRGGARRAVKPVLAKIHDIMRNVDIDVTRITVAHHRGARNWPTVALSYHRPIAVGPVCGDWSQDVAVNRERIHYPNYGCATQRNFAATVDNARDLLVPRDVTARSSERRSSQWQKYIGAAGKTKAQDTTSRANPLSDK